MLHHSNSEMHMPLEHDGRIFHDVLRFGKGDGPTIQCECGHSKGGDWPCPFCKTPRGAFSNLRRVYEDPYMDLQDGVDELKSTTPGRKFMREDVVLKESSIFDCMKREDLEMVMHQLGLPFRTGKTELPVMRDTIRNHYHGNKRPPAMFDYETKNNTFVSTEI